MNTLITITEKYLEYCKSQKRLDYKTIKAYRIDLKQFTSFCNNTDIHTLSAADIENFIGYLHQNFKPKTPKTFQFRINLAVFCILAYQF